MKKKYVLKKEIKNLLNKTLLTIAIFLIGMILIKQNPKFKENIKSSVYEGNIKFVSYKNFYEKYFGKFLSENKLVKKEMPVSSNKLSYKKSKKVKDGVCLQVVNNYATPVLESGVIIFIGTKDKLKNTIVVEQTNGINTYYSNIVNSNYKLYDYVSKGDVLGQVESDKLYLKFQKDGKYLDYQKYI